MAMRLIFPCTAASGNTDRINHGNALTRPPANLISSNANARCSASTRGRFSICRAVSDKDTTKEGNSSVEQITKKYGLEAGLWKIFTSKDGENGENGKEMKKNQAKQLLARYGGAYLATSLSLSVVSFTVCYLLINAGVDVQGLLDKSDLVELKNRCIKLENKSSLIDETMTTIRKDLSHNSNVPVNDHSYEIDEKIRNVVELAMIPIQKKINGNEEMLKHLLTLVNTGMKATLENLISLSNWLESNKDNADHPVTSQQMGPGTRTRSKKQKIEDPDLQKLRENVMTMKTQLVDSESFLKSLL